MSEGGERGGSMITAEQIRNVLSKVSAGEVLHYLIAFVTMVRYIARAAAK